uniref:NADH-ubiquinone oxidoreductase chain 4 n=2 Tax=Hyalomma TaxID=34625 RepID=A0A8E6Z645_9ACAR|nr:NADH dehydrogenase subunit 4 [Hyalomma anatolicum]QVV23889.1 NADH dehydrogenase subunit 4 [Hyalomma excavatum]
MLMILTVMVSIVCVFIFMTSYQVMIHLLLFTFFVILKTIINNGELLSSLMYADLMSLSMINLTIWISFLMILASNFLKIFKNKFFLAYTMMMMMFLILCFSAENLLMFYLFFESVLFPIMMMIINWGNQPERLQAGFYMLMYTVFGSLPLLILMLNKNITLSIIYNWWIFSSMGMMFFFMMLAFLVKIPMFLFHIWLPKAHVEAPVAGSMILAGVLLKLGFYGLYRFKNFFFIDLLNYSIIFMLVSIWGAVMISITCFFQIDVKSLIAFSSVSHMGVALSGCLTFFLYGSYGMLMMMIGHGLCSSALFCLSNLLYERFFTRNMFLIKGMMLIFPNLTLWWFLFSVINMSAPMTMNLFGELFLSVSLMKYSFFFIGPISLLIFFSACYSMYMYSYINHGKSWILYSNKPISCREYTLLMLHLFPMVIWFFKMNFFLKFI